MSLLITELTEEVEYLEELAGSVKNQYIHGKFLAGNAVNRNNRYYDIDILEQEVGRYNREYITNKRAFGELGHPQGPQINLDRVSHIITELKRDGNDFYGKALITNTPMGNIAKGLLESGAKLGVSSRGMGTIKATNEGVMYVQNDFKLATAADIVADPSAPGAFVNGIMENVNWVFDPIKGTWREELLHNIKKEVHTLSLREIEENKLAIFEDYIASFIKQ